jgi:homoserine kinase
MLSKDISVAQAVEKIMQDVYERLGIEYKTYVTRINKEGVRIQSGVRSQE